MERRRDHGGLSHAHGEELELHQDAREHRECGDGKGDSHEDEELRESGFVDAIHDFAKDDGDVNAAYERKRDLDGGDAKCFSTALGNGVEIKLLTHKEEEKKKAYAGYKFKRGQGFQIKVHATVNKNNNIFIYKPGVVYVPLVHSKAIP